MLLVSPNKTASSAYSQNFVAESVVSTSPLLMFSVVNSIFSNKTSCLPTAATCKNSECLLSTSVLHQRLGHPSSKILNHVIKTCSSFILDNKNTTFNFCDACQIGKMHQLHFPASDIKTKFPLEILHTNLWGPAPVISSQGYIYYISFVDDFIRFTWIFPLKTKSETLSVFKIFKNQIEKQLDKPIKCLQSDWGGEFRSFVNLLHTEGIHFRHSCPYTHNQNGIVERKHRHITELGLTLLAQANLPIKFWWESFHTATYLINRLPTPVQSMKSPYESIFHISPDYKFLRTFGCSCFPFLRSYNQHKFQSHTSKCIFLGYSPLHKGFKCLHSFGKIYIASHVVFYETSFPYSSIFSSSSPSKTSEFQYNLLQQYTIPITNSNLYRPFSALPCNMIKFLTLSFTKQKLLVNSITTSLSFVSLEMLIRFLVICGTKRISFSLKVKEALLELCDFNAALPISVISNPAPLPTTSLDIPVKASETCMLISLVRWCVAPLSKYQLVSAGPSILAKYADFGFLFGGGL